MIVPGQKILINWSARNYKHFIALGYNNFHKGDTIEVAAEELMPNSPQKILVCCDRCGAEKKITNQSYTKSIRLQNEYLCQDCHRQRDVIKMHKKIKLKSSEEKFQTVIKRNTTMMNQYGVDNAAKLESTKEKMKQTNLKKYGGVAPACNVEIQQKIIQTNQRLYGVNYTTQVPEVRKKMIETNLKNYGYDNPGSCPEFQIKAKQTLYHNGTCMTSNQQLIVQQILESLYGNCYLNYPCGRYSLDCMVIIDNVKIDVEYDGWYWHKKNSNKDQQRNQYVFKQGYRILRIKSGAMIPDVDLLKNAIQKLLANSTYEEIILKDWVD